MAGGPIAAHICAFFAALLVNTGRKVILEGAESAGAKALCTTTRLEHNDVVITTYVIENFWNEKVRDWLTWKQTSCRVFQSVRSPTMKILKV